MKISYLNGMFNFGFEVRGIQKKTIVNKSKKRRKIRRKYDKIFTIYTC
jgi:hypothetical protein